MVRFFPDGVVDSFFGTVGFAKGYGKDLSHVLVASPLHLLFDGSLLIATRFDHEANIQRFTPTGVRAAAFTRNGDWFQPYPGKSDLTLTAMAVQPNQRTVIIGHDAGNTVTARSFVRRITVDGKADPSFGAIK